MRRRLGIFVSGLTPPVKNAMPCAGIQEQNERWGRPVYQTMR